MKTYKKVLSVFLVVLLMALSVAVPSASSLFSVKTQAATALSGSCGQNLKWKIANNTLTISGTGKMDDFTSYFTSTGSAMIPYVSAPWFELDDKFTNIVVEKGVTHLGYSAFGFLNVNTITLPDTITTIANFALYFESINELRFDGSEEKWNEIEISGVVGPMLPAGTKMVYNCSCEHKTTAKTGVKAATCTTDGYSGDLTCKACGQVMTKGKVVAKLGHKDSDGNKICDNCKCTTIVASGTDGNIKWEFDIFNKLSITGTGKMPTYTNTSSNLPPWHKYNPKATALSISKGITSISDLAFRYIKAKSVKIPEGVTEIGHQAFEDSYIESISLPTTLKTIKNRVFEDCKYLKSINLPAGLTSIGSGAFTGCETLKSIVIPNNVTAIEDQTFMFCESFETVTLPSKLKVIGEKAFSGCTNIKSFDLPESLEEIKKCAFSSCEAIESFYIPSKVSVIEGGLFLGCDNLKTVTVSPENKHYKIAKSILYSTDLSKLVWVPKDLNLKTYTVPYAVKTICDYAFYNHKTLEKISLPSGLCSIGSYTFSKCSNLKGITIPNNVAYIGTGAFSECINLKSANIPTSLINIEQSTFYKCENLTSISIPNNVKRITNNAFAFCKNLSSVKMGNGIVYINTSAFLSCDKLKSVYIYNPDAVISDYAIGYFLSGNGGYERYDDFVIWGHSLSSADKYAKSNDFTFISLDEPHNHLYINKITKKPTCTAKGVRTYSCYCHYKYTKDIPALGHTSTVLKSKAPTCTATGLTAGKKCSTCGVILTAQKTIAKKAHVYKTTTTKATTTKNGGTVTKCVGCGLQKSSTIYYKISTIKLYTTNYTYDGKIKAPSVIIKTSSGATLKKNIDYTVSYSTGRKNVGKYKVTIAFKGKYSGTKTMYFTITPKATGKIAATQTASSIKATWRAVSGVTGYKVYLYKGSKLVSAKTVKTTNYNFSGIASGTAYSVKVKAYKTVNGANYYSALKSLNTTTKTKATAITSLNAGTNSATIKWSNVSGENGYEVYYATSRYGTYKKAATLNANATYTTVKNLTNGKTYYFKVRSYKTFSGVKLYSDWSAVKYVKVK